MANASPNGGDAQYDEKLKLRKFIENSVVELITMDGGVNNLCVLRATLEEGKSSDYDYFDFCTMSRQLLKTIVIKLILTRNGSKAPIKPPSKPSVTVISLDTVQTECTTQNTVYEKSIEKYGRPICPPILSVEINLSRERELLTLLLSKIPPLKKIGRTWQRENNNNTRLSKLLIELIQTKASYPIAFIIMGYINTNFRTVQQYTEKLGDDFAYLTNSNHIYAELYKLHNLGFAHCDFNTGNIMILNPYVNDSGRQKLLSEAVTTNATFDERLKLDRSCRFDTELPIVLLIDYGVAQKQRFNHAQTIDAILRCGRENERMLVDDVIDEEAIKAILREQYVNPSGAADEALVEMADRTVVTIEDKVDTSDLEECRKIVDKENSIQATLDELASAEEMAGANGNTADAQARKTIMLSDRLRAMTETPPEMPPEMTVLGRAMSAFGGGGRKLPKKFVKNIYRKFLFVTNKKKLTRKKRSKNRPTRNTRTKK